MTDTWRVKRRIIIIIIIITPMPRVCRCDIAFIQFCSYCSIACKKKLIQERFTDHCSDRVKQSVSCVCVGVCFLDDNFELNDLCLKINSSTLSGPLARSWLKVIKIGIQGQGRKKCRDGLV